MRKIIIVGNGGHAKVLKEALNLTGETDIIALDDDDEIQKYSIKEVELVNGIGSAGSVQLRASIFAKFKYLGYKFASVIHPTAILSNKATIGEGVQIMAGAIIQTEVKIADNVLINTGTIIDHECVINDHCHIAPGTVFSGNIIVEKNVHVGTGCSVIQNINIGQNSIIGAGSLVYKNIPPFSKAYGSKIVSIGKEFENEV